MTRWCWPAWREELQNCQADCQVEYLVGGSPKMKTSNNFRVCVCVGGRIIERILLEYFLGARLDYYVIPTSL